MSFKRPRRSLPSLPTSLTNPAGCPAEFRQDDQDRLAALATQSLFFPVSDPGRVSPGRVSPVSGRRSVSPVKCQRCISPNCSHIRTYHGLIHQPSSFGGYVGRFGSGMNTVNLLGCRPDSTCSGLSVNTYQHDTLRRHHSSGCTYPTSASSSNLSSFVSDENKLKHQNSCPGNLAQVEHPFQFSQINRSQHSSGSYQHSSGSLQHSFSASDSDDTDTEISIKNSSRLSGIYVRGAGLVHQGSIPCLHPYRKHSHTVASDSGCVSGDKRQDASSYHLDEPSSIHFRTKDSISRHTSWAKNLPGSLSPQQLSPSSSQASLRLESPSPTSSRSFDYIPCPSCASPSLSPPRSPHPPLQRNESMVYEEDVPVIVRRRGCMLRVRITSFVDPDGEESGDMITPVPVSI